MPKKPVNKPVIEIYRFYAFNTRRMAAAQHFDLFRGVSLVHPGQVLKVTGLCLYATTFEEQRDLTGATLYIGQHLKPMVAHPVSRYLAMPPAYVTIHIPMKITPLDKPVFRVDMGKRVKIMIKACLRGEMTEREIK